ncbi:hypothetical protein G7K_6665-t1 [Saitoella complicata NRRL Y-17804]|uniref:Uncharacterized protein n=1 Tax=Saitoella complicata (strain BCRC 22490 / CBS 7301 / JCM 7358 / NBRC 10748 / NRRL Y-17804) TaxID=698492 RepID=A0A0E9NRU0_SAICN|nr:hypothetical protein G7K_6665-t1 [Saitoella complicata NRRL Y-17804]
MAKNWRYESFVKVGARKAMQSIIQSYEVIRYGAQHAIRTYRAILKLRVLEGGSTSTFDLSIKYSRTAFKLIHHPDTHQGNTTSVPLLPRSARCYRELDRESVPKSHTQTGNRVMFTFKLHSILTKSSSITTGRDDDNISPSRFIRHSDDSRRSEVEVGSQQVPVATSSHTKTLSVRILSG